MLVSLLSVAMDQFQVTEKQTEVRNTYTVS